MACTGVSRAGRGPSVSQAGLWNWLPSAPVSCLVGHKVNRKTIGKGGKRPEPWALGQWTASLGRVVTETLIPFVSLLCRPPFPKLTFLPGLVCGPY